MCPEWTAEVLACGGETAPLNHPDEHARHLFLAFSNHFPKLHIPFIFYSNILQKLCSAPYARTRPTMNEHPHDAIRFPIPYDTMQRLLRTGRIERSRHFAAMMAQTAEAARAFVRGLIRKERFPAWSSRPGGLSGRPAC